MITAAEEVEQVAVIQAALDQMEGCGDVLGGARVAPNEWLVAVRYTDAWADAVMSVGRGRPDDNGVAWINRERDQADSWHVNRVEYGLPTGDALREVMRRATA